MNPLVLSRERFETIQRILERRGPTSARDLKRLHYVRHWELDQAENLGLIELNNHKPPVGRPSLFASIAGNVNKNNATNLLPQKVTLPQSLSVRHERFVWALALAKPKVRAYREAGYRPRSYAATRAGASRLARQHHIRAALRYTQRTGRFFCAFPHDIASFGGTPWLFLLQHLPVDPSTELRCRLAAGRTLNETRNLIKSLISPGKQETLELGFRRYDLLMGLSRELAGSLSNAPD